MKTKSISVLNLVKIAYQLSVLLNTSIIHRLYVKKYVTVPNEMDPSAQAHNM